MKYSEIARIYKIWWSIRDRCCRPGNPQYKNYGGRGITLSEPWMDFDQFMKDLEEDIGEKPLGDYELDRVNNEEGYKKGNIRWATVTENQRNKRNNTYYQTHIGKICKSELIEKLGFTRKQFDRYIEAHGIENLLDRFKNNDIPSKFVPINPEDLLGMHGQLNLLSYTKEKLGWLFDVECSCGHRFKMNQTSLKRRKFLMCKKCSKKGDLNGKRIKYLSSLSNKHIDKTCR